MQEQFGQRDCSAGVEPPDSMAGLCVVHSDATLLHNFPCLQRDCLLLEAENVAVIDGDHLPYHQWRLMLQ